MILACIRRRRAAAFVSACAVLTCFTFIGCSERHAEGFAGSGTLEATEVTVAAQTPGQILRLARDEGDAVAAGDTLARIDVEKLVLQRRQMLASIDEIQANRGPLAEAVIQARENLENLEKSYRRIAGLFEKGTATQQQYDDASTRYRLAQSQLESAKSQEKLLGAREETVRASIAVLDRQIHDGAVISPLSGILVEKYVEPGELVPVNGAICKIADTKRYWLKIYAGERDLGRFTVGETVTVRVDAYDTDLTGVVSWVSPEAEFTPKNIETRDARAELVYAVKVSIEEPPSVLKIGMPAEVYLR
jgi:HlyD family secretion protein